MKNAKAFEFVNAVVGFKFVTIISKSDVDLKVGTSLRGRVTKVSKCQYGFGASYENSVNNHLSKVGLDGCFESEPLRWGNWVKDLENRVIEHKGNYYLRAYGIDGKHAESYYYVDGVLATDDEVAEIKEYLYSKSYGSKTQSAVGLDEHQVVVKNIRFDNLIEIHFDGVIYKDIDDDECERLVS